MITTLYRVSTAFLMSVLLFASPSFALGFADPMVKATAAGTIFQRSYYLTGGTTYQFETKSLSPSSADTMMRLWIGSAEVARDDDGGEGKASKIRYRPSSSGWFLLIIHSRLPGTYGSGEIWLNGVLDTNFNFGGHPTPPWESVPYLANIQTAHEIGGVDSHQLLVIAGLYPDGFGQRKSNLTVSYPRQSVILPYTGGDNTSALAVVGTTTSQVGAVSTALNVTQVDSDGDGLGDALETHLRTCPRHSAPAVFTADGWDCTTFKSGDTDNDGLSDYAEVFGACVSGDCLSLRWWGASPTHKDIFVEVDYTDGTYGPLNPLIDRFNTAYVNAIYSAYQAPSAIAAKNPDGQAGVRLHWEVKGATQLNLVNNAVFLFDGGASGPVASPDGCYDLNRRLRRLDSSTPARRSFFHYNCAKTASGGQADLHGLTFGASPSVQLAIHELGHNLSLTHNGAPFPRIHAKVNYVSVMTYAHQNNQPFSTGVRTELNDRSLCETDGLGSSGGTKIDVSPLSLAPNFFKVDLANGYVDWNRDGSFQGCGSLVQGSIHWAPNMASRVPGWRSQQIAVPSPAATGTPAVVTSALADAQDFVHVLYPTGDSAAARYRVMPFNGACPDSATSTSNGGECGTFSSVQTTGKWARTISATRFPPQNSDMFIAVRRPDDSLKVYQAPILANSSPPGLLGTLVEVFSHAGPIIGTPTILRFGENLHLAWLQNHTAGSGLGEFSGVADVWATYMTSSGVWSTPQDTLFTSRTSPVFVVRPGTSALLYLLRTDEQQYLDFIYKSGSSWVDSNSFSIPTNCSGQMSGCGASTVLKTDVRPGVTWLNARPGLDTSGAMQIYWVPAGGGGKLRRLHFSGHTGSDKLTRNVNGYLFDDQGPNRAAAGTGFSAAEAPGSNGSVAVILRPDAGIWFFPHAAGILGETATDYSDHAAIDPCPSFNHPDDLEDRPCGPPNAQNLDPSQNIDEVCDLEGSL